MAATKRFYCVRHDSAGMGGGSIFVAVLAEEPAPAANLTVYETDPATALFDWRLKEPNEEAPPRK